MFRVIYLAITSRPNGTVKYCVIASITAFTTAWLALMSSLISYLTEYLVAFNWHNLSQFVTRHD
jgi:hypothetical protein